MDGIHKYSNQQDHQYTNMLTFHILHYTHIPGAMDGIGIPGGGAGGAGGGGAAIPGIGTGGNPPGWEGPLGIIEGGDAVEVGGAA